MVIRVLKKRKIGLLGGSFNPPHAGHIHISKQAVKILDLETVWWIISPQNPLKKEYSQTYESRVKACNKILRTTDIKISQIEKKEGNVFSFNTIKMLKKRSDFLFSNKYGIKINGNFVNLQKFKKKEFSNDILFGITVTKKIGMSVIRNKIKRRLKSIIRFLLIDSDKYFDQDFNYVFISKSNLINAKFEDIKIELMDNLKKLK